MTVWIVTKNTEHSESDTTDIVKIFDSKEKAIEYYNTVYDNKKWSITYDYEEFEVE